MTFFRRRFRRSWNHCNARGTADFNSVGLLDINFIRCWEEETYQPRITAIVEYFRSSPLSADVTPDFDLIYLDCPYSSNWSLLGQQHLFLDLNFESRFRRDSGIDRVIFFWHNVEAFAIPPSFRNNMYLAFQSWWEDCERSPLLNVATSPVILYHSRDSIVGKSKEQ